MSRMWVLFVHIYFLHVKERVAQQRWVIRTYTGGGRIALLGRLWRRYEMHLEEVI